MPLPDKRRWLILAAHYDDEALMFGSLAWALHDAGREVRIAVLTAVAETNPPTTDEQRAGEPERQRRRLAAFEAVCEMLGASPLHLHQIQLATLGDDCDKALAATLKTETLLRDVVQAFKTDVIVTHGFDGEYTAEKYRPGWSIARQQHAWAARLATAAGVPVMRRDPDGDIIIPHDYRKLKLLEWYRHGTTRQATWDFDKIYTEFVNEPERYSLRGLHRKFNMAA